MLACAPLAQELPIVDPRSSAATSAKQLNAVRSALQSKKCMIDEGNGRYTPCEAMVKPKKAKKKG
jgi:hypothetical protein